MYLTNEEERALKGEYGESLSTAYTILVAVGRLTEASRLIPISSAHISGVSYLTIGDYGADFLEEFSRTAKVSVNTTVNPCGMDIEGWSRLGFERDFAERQLKIVEAYRRMGVEDSFTCVPYEGYNIPPPGSHVSWAESSAAIYANSILGLKTNRESSLSALASAVTGKTPYSDLHLEENRRPGIIVNVKIGRVMNTLDYGLLGFFSGRLTNRPIGFKGISRLSREDAKALSAALGTSGSSGMFILDPDIHGLEAVDFTDIELNETYDMLNDVGEGDAVVFGCPQLTLNEIEKIALYVKGKKFSKKYFFFCSRRVYNQAEELGYVEIIQKAGGQFVKDACADFTPLIGYLNVDSVVTDTCKGAYYIKRIHNIKICLKDTLSIIREFSV